MRSVNSTPALSSSGYSKPSSGIFGHCCDGGRLSRVNVSMCAVRPSNCIAMIILLAGVEGEGILAVRPVQLDAGESTVHAPEKMRGMPGGHCGHASPSQSLLNDFNFADICSASRTV